MSCSLLPARSRCLLTQAIRTSPDAPETEAAANALGRRLEVLTASTEGDLEAAFTTMVKRQAGALIVMPDPFFFARREQLVALAARYAVPTIYPIREFTEIGGLMSYGTNLSLDYISRQGPTPEKFSGAPNRLTFPSNKASS